MQSPEYRLLLGVRGEKIMRTDIHSEKNLKPEDYEVIEYLYTKAPEFFGSVGAFADEMAAFRANMELIQKMLKERGAMIHGGWSNCDHCGAYYHHGVLLEHRETRELITVGWICAEERFSVSNFAWKRKRLEKVMKQIKHRRGLFAKLRTFASENKEAVHLLNKYHEKSKFIESLRDQLINKGSLSRLQINCIPKAAERAATWVAKRAEEDAKPKVPAPEGRVEIQGEVVHTRVDDGYYGSVIKMMVQCEGFKVWGTAPDCLLSETVNNGGLRGHKIKFRATLTRSDKDESFAFAKRPTNAELV